MGLLKIKADNPIMEVVFEHLDNISKTFHSVGKSFKTTKIPYNTIQLVLNKSKLNTNDKSEKIIKLYSDLNLIFDNLEKTLLFKQKKGKVKLKTIDLALFKIKLQLKK